MSAQTARDLALSIAVFGASSAQARRATQTHWRDEFLTAVHAQPDTHETDTNS